MLVIGAFVASRNELASHHTKGQASNARPTVWDARVSPLVSFVESHRGLTFAHPVPIAFLDEADYVSLFSTDGAGVDDDARTKAETAAQLVDAEGLAAGYDPIETDSTVSATTTLGFYDPGSDQIFVRGSDLTAAVRVVLVHELTHALQAQHFTFTLGGPDDLAKRAIVEGDAMRIEDEYTQTLPEGERSQAIEDNSADASTDTALADVPWALVDERSAPYRLGPMFLEVIGGRGGNGAVDQVFADFPTDEELVSPSIYNQGQADATIIVEAPPAATVVDNLHAWKMFDALVMLDAWLPWQQARTPFDGWAGGGMVSYHPAGSPDLLCFTATARFDTAAQTSAFADAVTAWSGLAGSRATPAIVGSDVSFESCTRGANAALPPRPVISTADEAVLEHWLADGYATSDAGPDPALARCVARTLIDDPDMVPLFTAETLTAAQRDIFTLKTELGRTACTSG